MYSTDTVFLLDTRMRKLNHHSDCTLLFYRDEENSIYVSDARGSNFTDYFVIPALAVHYLATALQHGRVHSVEVSAVDSLIVHGDAMVFIWTTHNKIRIFDVDPSFWFDFIRWMNLV